MRVPHHQKVRVRRGGGDRLRQVPDLKEGGGDPAHLAVQAACCVRGVCGIICLACLFVSMSVCLPRRLLSLPLPPSDAHGFGFCSKHTFGAPSVAFFAKRIVPLLKVYGTIENICVSSPRPSSAPNLVGCYFRRGVGEWDPAWHVVGYYV